MDDLQRIERHLAEGPSEPAWDAILGILTELAPDSAAVAVALLAPLRAWPPRLRALASKHPWARTAFDPAPHPGLALVGYARLAHRWTLSVSPDLERCPDRGVLVRAFARRLDPTFDPPPTVLSEGNEIRYANGCGGGRAWQQVGSPDRWLLWENNAVENSADMSEHHCWTVHGLPPDCAIEVSFDNDRDFAIAVQGPTPEVFAIARVWGELSRRALTVEEALALLAG